jgi:hypothetical protein
MSEVHFRAFLSSTLGGGGGHLRAPVTLPPRKEPPISIKYETGRTSEPV